MKGVQLLCFRGTVIHTGGRPYLSRVTDALQVERGDSGAGERLSRVLAVTLQNLPLQISTHGVHLVMPRGREGGRGIRIETGPASFYHSLLHTSSGSRNTD